MTFFGEGEQGFQTVPFWPNFGSIIRTKVVEDSPKSY